MMLDYYDRYYNNNFIPSDLESPTGRALIDYIVANYIPTNSSSGAQLTGLQNYVNARNVGYTVDQTPLKYDPISGYYTFDPTIAANSINSDKPFIVQLTNDSVSKDGSLKFGNHEVAAYGYATVQYDTNSSPNYMYTIVNDGWGHTSVWIDKRYQTYLTYIR
ncbi:hypothetical protein [Clostridium sp. OS1-26]|uniref:hypothetical protein n=1 Tax=Clostridium sp. OS1-26 TaxID=3070681 RepID=UPI0027E1D22B|nr:hypothetical protein [Clostridium sp. OS1-26]WML36193.1 hypothetical protein RCG18_05620 [Clostridium sp. OS1-26]